MSRFRQRTIISGLCLGISLFVHASVQAQRRVAPSKSLKELLTFADRDLHKLNYLTSKRIETLTKAVLGSHRRNSVHPLEGDSLRLRIICRIRTPEARIVLLDSPTGFFFPGQQVHYLYFLDESGKLVGFSDFSTGWRMGVDEVKVVRRHDLQLLAFSTWGAGGFAFAPSMREYFALAKDRAVVVRLEGKNGLISNSYICPYPAVGPPVPKRSANEWISALSSPDWVEVLQALTWIGGRHPDIEELKQEQEEEEFIRKQYPGDPKSKTTLERCPAVVDEAKLFGEMIARKDLAQKLKAMTQSPNAWIRESAEFAAQQVARQSESARRAFLNEN